nr:uncharacterized mitochondrial protein AtMg00810-like [Tanacetum cinerariifolium]
QPLFNELLTPPPSVNHPAPKVIALIPEVVASEPAASTGLPSSTIVDQDAPSPSNSQSTLKTQPLAIPNDVKEYNHDIEVAHMGNDPFFGILILEVPSDQSSSSDIIHTIVHPDHQISKRNNKWTKDHPLENIIGELARQMLFTQSCWIEAMQEELNEFERLEVWELVPRPDKVMVITLKWIYNVKLDELEGLKISQSPKGIFINQSKYALEYLKKYGFESCDPVDIPMVEKSKLDEDKEGKVVDPSHYHGMIGTLIYLTTSRPDLQFAICMCAWYYARPTEKHLHAVKKIFRYLRGTVNRGLWYLKDYSIALIAFTDADHAGCQDTYRSTSVSFQFLEDRLISWLSKRQKSDAISSTEAEYIALSSCCAQILWMRS